MKKFSLRKAFLILVLFVSLVSCKKEQDTSSLHNIVWIESKGRTDTLVFVDNSMLLLSRPKVQTGPHLIPKIGSGHYTYQSLKDSITLQYSLSSLYAPKKYAYKVEGHKLYIGDFYEKTSATLVFEKLK